jgi:hypothetical protein
VAIYRAESGRRVAIVAIVALVGGLILGLAIGRVMSPTLASQVTDLRTQAAPIRSAAEIVRTEYPKLVAGGADTGGAAAAMARIKTTFDSIAPSLTALDAAGTDDLRAAIEALDSAIKAKAPEADVASGVDAMLAALDAVLPGGPVPSGG